MKTNSLNTVDPIQSNYVEIRRFLEIFHGMKMRAKPILTDQSSK